MAYFFHLTEGDEVTFDQDGIDLPDVRAAQMVALRTIGELVAEAVANGERNYHGAIQVQDDEGGTMLTFTFACPVNIEGSAGEAGAQG
jgi:hypothetical protein